MSGHEDEGHGHLPAVEDWPRGFGEASWWPFVAALGVTGFYVGAALFVLGRGQDPVVGSAVGPAAVIVSTFVFLAGLYGWLYHAFVANFWSHAAESSGHSGLRWGMILFLCSEVATFGAGFVYYFFIRSGAWPPAEVPHLLGSLILINTGILVVSSLTLHWAHVKLRRGDRQSFMRWLAATVLLGVVFIGGQVYEYYEFVVNEGFGLGSGAFGSAFYGLTGLHGLHVTMGAVLLGIVLARAVAGQYDADNHVSVSTASMYWHFVDAVWLFLVVVLYVGAEATF